MKFQIKKLYFYRMCYQSRAVEAKGSGAPGANFKGTPNSLSE